MGNYDDINRVLEDLGCTGARFRMLEADERPSTAALEGMREGMANRGVANAHARAKSAIAAQGKIAVF